MHRTGQLSVYRNCLPVVDEQYSTDGTRDVIDALTDAVAAAEGVHATDLPPLFDVIDLDAISTLFDRDSTTGNAETILGFTYENWNVYIRADGRIRVCDRTKLTEPELVFDDTSHAVESAH